MFMPPVYFVWLVTNKFSGPMKMTSPPSARMEAAPFLSALLRELFEVFAFVPWAAESEQPSS